MIYTVFGGEAAVIFTFDTAGLPAAGDRRKGADANENIIVRYT